MAARAKNLTKLNLGHARGEERGKRKKEGCKRTIFLYSSGGRWEKSEGGRV